MRLKLAMMALLALGSTAVGQDHAMHMPAAPDLPALCLANAAKSDAMAMPMAPTGDAAHQDLMDGMYAMNADMMAGGTATDLDVAFVCSMIPHHRGAIDMAKAELAHGDDPWARKLAEGIIAAQEKEIREMMAWLEGQK
jgi:uncharacterized protein (DUF305 family)